MIADLLFFLLPFTPEGERSAEPVVDALQLTHSPACFWVEPERPPGFGRGLTLVLRSCRLSADGVFITHHVIASIYLIGCLHHGHGAIGCIMM